MKIKKGPKMQTRTLQFLCLIAGVLFWQSSFANDCDAISSKFAGSWQYAASHTMRFTPGSSNVEIDGRQAPMSACIVVPNVNVSFSVNGQYTIIYPSNGSGTSMMLMGLNQFRLDRIDSSNSGTLGTTPAVQAAFNVGRYEPPQSPALMEYARYAQSQKYLENTAEYLNRNIHLPTPITLNAKECGEANAFYSPQSHNILLCYELVQQATDFLVGKFRDNDSPQAINTMITGAVAFVLLHEAGHGLVDVLHLPVLGREEDAADQLSAYMLLKLPPQQAVTFMAGAAWFFNKEPSATLLWTRYADEHGLDQQRFVNVVCFAYGKDPSDYVAYVRNGVIPEGRALSCPHEYQKFDADVRKLLSANLNL